MIIQLNLPSSKVVIFTNNAGLDTDNGLAYFFVNNSGDSSVIVNNSGTNIDELVAPNTEDYAFLTPAYLSGITTGLYTILYSFTSGAVFLGEDAPALLITDVDTFDLDYDNQVVILSDGLVDVYLLTIADIRHDDVLMVILSITVPTSEFEQYEETVMAMVDSIVLPTTE